LQRPKTGKFDYLSEPNHLAHSMAFKFFTDDYDTRPLLTQLAASAGHRAPEAGRLHTDPRFQPHRAQAHSRSAENDQAAWAGRRSHIGWDLVHYGSAASQCVDVLHALRQRHFKPAFAAILSAEHLAIARRDVDLLGVAVMQTDRHQRAVRRHPVKALPSL